MNTLNVHSIFPSINGEVNAYHQGSLCTFIRLAGCPLRCSYCFGVVSGRHIPKVILSERPNKKIFDVKIGDKLLTFNNKKELVETEVTNLVIRKVDSWLRIKIENHEYFVTEEHPFFTTKGLKQAKNLQVGDEIYHSHFKDKLSFKMRGNKNPMTNEDVKKRVFENTDYKAIGKKVSTTIKRKQAEGIYISSFDSLSKNAQKEVREKLSLSKMGDKNPNWKGGIAPNYEKLKQQIKKGKIKFCSKCLEPKPLDVHHKDNDHENDASENLEILCESCHYTIHKIGYNFWKNNNRVDGKRLIAMNGLKVLSIKKINRNNFPPSIRPKPLKVYNLSCKPYNSFLIDYMWVHNCDTVYAQDSTAGRQMTVEEIVSKVVEHGAKTHCITITGGEPLLQQNELIFLIDQLWGKGYKQISIETNGTYKVITWWPVCWVVDYKTSSSRMMEHMLLSNYKQLGTHDCIKFVVADKKDFSDAIHLITSQGITKPVLAFSPVFVDCEPINVPLLLQWIMQTEALANLKVVMNIQIHKIVNLP